MPIIFYRSANAHTVVVSIFDSSSSLQQNRNRLTVLQLRPTIGLNGGEVHAFAHVYTVKLIGVDGRVHSLHRTSETPLVCCSVASSR